MFLMLVYLRKYRYPFFSSNVQIGELFFKWPTSSNQTAKRLFTRYQIIFIEFQVRDQVTSADNFMLYWVTLVINIQLYYLLNMTEKNSIPWILNFLYKHLLQRL